MPVSNPPLAARPSYPADRAHIFIAPEFRLTDAAQFEVSARAPQSVEMVPLNRDCPELILPEPQKPENLGHALRIHAKLLRGREYAQNFAALMVGAGGRGLGRGGILLMLNGLQGAEGGLPILAVSLFDWLEQMGRCIGVVEAAYQRDMADLTGQARSSPSDRAKISQKTGELGMLGVACTSAIGLASLGAVAVGLSSSVVVPAIAVIKAGQTYYENREMGTYNCLKVHLGNEQERQEQAALNRLIVADEFLAITQLDKLLPSLIYVGGGLATRSQSALSATALGCIGGGTSIAALAKCYYFLAAFWERHRTGDSAPQTAAQPATSLRASMLECLALLRQYDYGSNFTAVICGSLGNGIAKGGALSLVNAINTQNPLLPVLAATGFDWLEQLGRGVSLVQANYERDMAEIDTAPRGSRSERARLSGNIAHYGLRVVGCAAVALGCGVGYCYGMLPAAALLLMVGATKTGQGYFEMRETGAYNCLKIHLGSEEAQDKQAKYNRLIGALEFFAQNNLDKVAQPILFALATQRSESQEELARNGLTAMAAGVALALLSKLFFLHQAR